jgi:hypothetical protein
MCADTLAVRAFGLALAEAPPSRQRLSGLEPLALPVRGRRRCCLRACTGLSGIGGREAARTLAFGAALIVAVAASSSAEEPAAPFLNYVAGFLGTTLGFRPPDGAWDGWHDATFSRLLGS